MRGFTCIGAVLDEVAYWFTEDSSNPAEVEAKRGIFLQFQLKGLGGVGNELDDVLSDSISGFEYRQEQLSNR